MFTHYYKGFYIHGYCDKAECFWGFPGYVSKPYKSYRGCSIGNHQTP